MDFTMHDSSTTLPPYRAPVHINFRFSASLRVRIVESIEKRVIHRIFPYICTLTCYFPFQPRIMSGALEVIFDTTGFGLNPVEKNEDFLNQLEHAKINHLDTARQCDGSEAMLRMLGAPSRFLIDSKIQGLAPHTLTRFDYFLSSSFSHIANEGFTPWLPQAIEDNILTCA